MKLELHILQNFAPSNLNRDDTGSPKDCELGGVRRARISSQCYKRAIRQAFDQQKLLPQGDLAARTKRLITKVAERVMKAKGVEEGPAKRAVTSALAAGGLKADEDETQYLLFLPTRALDALAGVVSEHFDKLSLDAPKAEPADSADPPKAAGKKGPSKKKEKSEAKDSADPAVRAAVEKILKDASRTPELALFGRMIADQPGWNVEAACQVAHAISTHRVSMEFDFYTAVDDLRDEGTAGSGMMGTIQFNSACFYRYLVVDIGDLKANLGSDGGVTAQARQAVEALVRAAVLAIPTGKQNSMAAHNPPSLVFAEVSDGAPPRSLANAFVDPVRPRHDSDLVAQSVLRLGAYAASLDKVYGAKGRVDRSFVVLDPSDELAKGFNAKLPAATNRASLDDLVSASLNAALGAA
ncbi:MAG: type I-E CRISPR-associated protein Cas7/Cse4/CasC [Polyangiaceae bacterium]